MKVAALFSGGKDSTYAIYLAQSRGWEVTELVTMVPEAGESYMFHVPNIGLCGMLAEAMGIAHARFPTSGEEELELEDLGKALARLKVRGVVSGAIASDYQHTRIDRLCHGLGLVSHSPLWRRPQEAVLKDIVTAGFRVMVVGVYAEGLGKEWLGRILDGKALAELGSVAQEKGINVSGEGGEFETLVLDGPNFAKRLDIIGSETIWQGNHGEFLVKKAMLAGK